MPEVVELYVVMHCEACAASVKRAVRKIPGVEFYEIDFYAQKVTVVGNVEREDVWRRIFKTGKRVTLIPQPPSPPKEEHPKEEKPKEENPKEEKPKEEKPKEPMVEVKVEEKKEEKATEAKEETKVVDTKEEVKVQEKEEVVTVVETTEAKAQEKAEAKKKEPQPQPQPRPRAPEWVPMFVSAPYYTLPTRFYYY